LPFNLGTTGIGSHPIGNPERIILDILESGITVPYIPQLKTEEMVMQFHNQLPGLVFQRGRVKLNVNTPNFEKQLKSFKDLLKLKTLLLSPRGIEVSPEYFRGLFLFPELLVQTPTHYRGIKCQMTGPITEAASIKIYPGNNKLIQNSELFDIIVGLSSEIAYWLSTFLIRVASANNIPKENVILFIDEPLFPQAIESEISYDEALEKISNVLKLVQCRTGIHICDNPISVIDRILQYPFDIFSYDAIKYPNSLKSVRIDILQDYISRGGGIAFGITPNTPESTFGIENIPSIMKGDLNPEDFIPTPDDLIQTFNQNIEPLEARGIPLQQLLSQSLITPACGFRNFNIPDEEKGELFVKQLLQLQEQAAQKLRKEYDLI